MTRMTVDEIEALSDAALRRHGAQPEVAAEMARAIAWAEARGNRICGLYYLESYCQQLQTGRVDGRAIPVTTQPRAAEVRVDARNGFAQPALRAGLASVLRVAETCGVASLALSNAHTCTALGYFCEAIALGGCIALGMTNASPIVAAPGGRTRVIGTNPVSFAVPDGQGGVSMIFDMSTTTVALGKITMARAAGEAIPEGWALDAEGRPTTDPEAALKGSLTSAGGHKGWGFGLMAEVLVAALAGGRMSAEVAPLKAPEGEPHGLAQYFIVIHPGEGAFFDRMSALSTIVSQDDGCRMPGQGKEPARNAEVPEALAAQLHSLASGAD